MKKFYGVFLKQKRTRKSAINAAKRSIRQTESVSKLIRNKISISARRTSAKTCENLMKT